MLAPLERVEGHGFRELSWEAALDRTAREIQRIQAAHGRDAFAVLTGASLSNERAYLMGKFARVALRSANIDYNGRLCMVSAGAASKRVLGVDRSANPWSDIPKAEVVLIAGANVAECAPITTSYLWQARENGAKLIVLDPRMTPLARTVDLFIPVRPGGDIGVFNGMLHVMIDRGWIARDFLAAHTTGWAEVEEGIRRYPLDRAAAIAGVPRSMIVRAAELWGPARSSFLLHARGIEHHSKGVENCMAAINLVLASGRIGREGCGYAMITGQGNGQGAREQGQKCDQLPGARDIDNPEDRRYVASVWGVAEESIPRKGLSAVPLVEAIHEGTIKGLLLLCFNPLVSLPDQRYVREALERLEFFVVLDFFLSETARHADLVLPTALMEEDEGTTTSVEGRVIHHRKAVDPPPSVREDWRVVCDLAARLGSGDKFPFRSPREIFEELRVASKGGVADYAGITWEKIDERMGVFWPCPTLDHPGTPRLYEGGHFGHADGKAHLAAVEWRPAAEEPDAEYPILLTTGRVVSPSTCRGHRPVASAPWSTRCRSPPARSTPASRPRSASPIGTGCGSRAGAAPSPCAPSSPPPSGRTRSSSPTIGPSIARRTAARSARLIRSRRSPSSRSARSESFVSWGRTTRAPVSSRPLGVSGERARLLHRLFSLHRLPCLREGVRGVRYAPGTVDDSPRDHRSRALRPDRAAGLHALRGSNLRARLPGGRDQADHRRGHPELAQAPLHRLPELCSRVPVRRTEVCRRLRSDDEVRLLLRSHEQRQATDVRDRLPLGGALLHLARGDRAVSARPGDERVVVRR